MEIYPATSIDKARRAGPTEFHQLGNENPANLYIVQRCVQRADEWTPLAQGTPFSMGGTRHPSYLLVEEQSPEYDGDVRYWNRVYAPIFQSFDTAESWIMSDVPGMAGGEGAGATTSFTRPTQSVVLATKVVSTFFFLGVSCADVGTASVVTSFDQIPQLNRIPIFGSNGIQDSYSGATNKDLDELVSIPAWYPDAIAGQTLTEAQYWDSKVLAGSWMVAEGSRIERWRGPLFVRQTRYFRAL